MRSGSIVVTDGADSLYGSRTVFQQLYDFGSYKSITACSASSASAKKALLTRSARYSGLLDVLGFHEGAPEAAFADADTWLAINPAEDELASQISAAASAGVGRVFLLITDMLRDSDALDAALSASGMQYTVVRTGSLVDGAPVGSGLKLDELDVPACEDVPKEDVFRFVTEALTLDEAHGRAFSLCPSVGLTSTLRQMRVCGYDRRDEIQVLLQGLLKEEGVEAAPPTAEEAEAEAELVMRSEAELAAEREEELKMLLSRAKAKGIETQMRLQKEEKEKAEKREEMRKYYTTEDKPEDKPPAASDDDAKPDIPDTPPKA